MGKWKPRFRSTFQKMALAFLLLGVLPMLCVCLLFLLRYEANARLSIESTLEQANYYAQTRAADLVDGIDQSMEYLYDYAGGEFASLSEILESAALSENERRMYLGVLLDHFLQADPAVSAAYFVTASGTVYNRFYGQQKSLRDFPLEARALPRTGSRLRQLFLLPAADEAQWCNYSTDTVLSLARNYMDTRSLKAVTDTVLGTLYVDVRTEALDGLLSSIRLGAGGNAAIVDGQSGAILYRLREDAQVPAPQAFDFRGGRFSSAAHTVFYQPIGGSSYHLLLSFDRRELYSTYTSNRSFLFLLLGAAAALVLALGLAFSGRISRPARALQRAMQQVRQGDLNARVDLRTGDEMEELGRGFNRMVEELGETIQEVYVAQLCQRDAELNALKMQIQPHYLYNTLDIIRMSALECGGEAPARLIESLSRQLRYVIGDHRERVRLRRELDSLREYAVLMDARYEGRIRLSIEATDAELDLYVPKLLLQPFVENAVKHGLRERPEGGTVLVEAQRLEDCLQILVLNDGAPIAPGRLEHIRAFLAHAAVGEQDGAGVVSVGMKNTYDRIRLNCGEDYGFTMDSSESMGVIVTIRLPVWREEGEHVEDSAG